MTGVTYGGPTEIRQREQTLDTEDLNSIPSDLEIEEDNIPDAPTFPLNSKRLNAVQIRQMAAALNVPTRAAADEARQMLGEKIRTLGHDPANVIKWLLSYDRAKTNKIGDFLCSDG